MKKWVSTDPKSTKKRDFAKTVEIFLWWGVLMVAILSFLSINTIYLVALTASSTEFLIKKRTELEFCCWFVSAKKLGSFSILEVFSWNFLNFLGVLDRGEFLILNWERLLEILFCDPKISLSMGQFSILERILLKYLMSLSCTTPLFYPRIISPRLESNFLRSSPRLVLINSCENWISYNNQ